MAKQNAPYQELPAPLRPKERLITMPLALTQQGEL
jgi:hypothetical protein